MLRSSDGLNLPVSRRLTLLSVSRSPIPCDHIGRARVKMAESLVVVDIASYLKIAPAVNNDGGDAHGF